MTKTKSERKSIQNRTDGQNPLRGWWKHCGKVLISNFQLYRHPHKFHTSHLPLFTMRLACNESDSFSKQLSIVAAVAAVGVVVAVAIIIIVALQLTQFRVKLHKLWSFQSVAFTDCRMHDVDESYFVAINDLAFAIPKGVRFSANSIASIKAHASKACTAMAWYYHQR